MYKPAFLILVAALFLAGCDWQVPLPSAASPTPFLITATLPPTAVPPATLTALPPTPAPTTAPVEGLTTTQLNVRDEPSSAGAQLGMLAAAVTVRIIGRDAGNNWYQIQYSGAQAGKAWVTAQYINVQGQQTIPIVGAPAVTGSLIAGTGVPAVTGTVIEQVNVRKGPGTDSDALGLLNPKDVVTLIGRDTSGSWLQIQYAAAPDRTGWVAANYIQADGQDSLPMIGSSGVAVATGTPTGAPPMVTPIPAPALLDHDSAEQPAVNITFSPTGTRTLIYSSDVSAPEGDSDDWIQFTPFGTSVVISLSCTGNSLPSIGLLQAGSEMAGWQGVRCGETLQVPVLSGKAYLLHLSAATGKAPLAYVSYTIKLDDLP